MRDEGRTKISCGCAIAALVFNFIVGGWSVNYLLQFFIEKTIPFLGAAFIGLIVGEISVPIAIVVWILRAGGVL